MLADFQELWLTSRRDTLPKSNEVQAINVAKTCDKLRLAITQPRKDLQRSLDVTVKNQGNDLTFRSVSRLCYTTLRVHELQVNDLLNRSEMLVAQSGSWSAFKFPVKRKCSQSFVSNGSFQAKRKRHSIESTISVTDYTQLLDDTENFVEWSKSTEVVNKTVSNMTKRNGHGSRTTCIHIREITINEVDTHHAERYTMDEDEGFGNATADELKTLMQMMEDQTISHTKAAKRKMGETRSICEKRSKSGNVAANKASQVASEETEIEIARSAGELDNGTVVDFSPSQINHGISTLNESLGEVIDDMATRNMENIDRNSFETMDNNSNDICLENNHIEEQSACSNVMHVVCDKQQQNCSITLGKSVKQAKSKNKVIFDECTELTPTEIRTQLQVQVDLRTKIRKLRAKVKFNKNAYNITPSRKYYERIPPTVNALLNTLNRSCIAMRKFKMKNKKPASLDDSIVNSAKRSLLREILNREITDDLVKEIYENYNSFGKNNRRSLHFSAAVQENLSLSPEMEDDYNQLPLVANNEISSDAINDNNNNIDNVECVGEISSTANEQGEFGTFDIMVQLVNLWRSKKVLRDEIHIDLILRPTGMLRKQAAKAFYALLKLAANGFIVLLTNEKSAHLQRIKLGPASTKLIQKSDFSGMTLKRRHNGYRIHAN